MKVWPLEPSPGLCSCDRNLFASALTRAGEELSQEGREAGSSVLGLLLLRTTSQARETPGNPQSAS